MVTQTGLSLNYKLQWEHLSGPPIHQLYKLLTSTPTTVKFFQKKFVQIQSLNFSRLHFLFQTLSSNSIMQKEQTIQDSKKRLYWCIAYFHTVPFVVTKETSHFAFSDKCFAQDLCKMKEAPFHPTSCLFQVKQTFKSF